MANTLKGYTANLLNAAVKVAQAGEDLEISSQRFVDLAISKDFPVEAFSAPKKNDQGEYPMIVYKGGKVSHEIFWRELKAGVAEILPSAVRKHAIYDTFPKYRDATFSAEAWGEMQGKHQQMEKDAFKYARQRINPRIRDIRQALERAYRGESETAATTPEVRLTKSLFKMSESIGKMEVTSSKLLEAKKHIDAAIAALKVSD